jgi:hypothetical protein
MDPAKVIEHSSTDFRVLSGDTELKRFTDRNRAVAYARGWNSVKKT